MEGMRGGDSRLPPRLPPSFLKIHPVLAPWTEPSSSASATSHLLGGHHHQQANSRCFRGSCRQVARDIRKRHLPVLGPAQLPIRMSKCKRKMPVGKDNQVSPLSLQDSSPRQIAGHSVHIRDPA